MLDFDYEPDERPKRKHHWNRPEPGFVKEGNALVGKCPNSIDASTAKTILSEGEPYVPRGWTRAWPKRIYAVIDGVPYRATPTTAGRTSHGFPEHPSELRRLPASFVDRLRERARAQGRLVAFERWLRR